MNAIKIIKLIINIFPHKHEWRYIGKRITESNIKGQYIYECNKCNKIEITDHRRTKAINDCITDNIEITITIFV